MAYPAWAHHPSNDQFNRLWYQVQQLEETVAALTKRLEEYCEHKDSTAKKNS